jgi:hypothetical protein
MAFLLTEDKMIDTNIGNRSDAERLIAKLFAIADRCVDACPCSDCEMMDQPAGLEALKDALERGGI